MGTVRSPPAGRLVRFIPAPPMGGTALGAHPRVPMRLMGTIPAVSSPWGSTWARDGTGCCTGLSLVPTTGFELAAKLLIPRRRRLSLRDLEASRLTSARCSQSIWKIGFKTQESG